MEIKFSHYGEERDLNCTEAELDIFHIIRSVCDDDGLDASIIELVRKSDNYVSAVMPSSKGYGDMDIARFKFTSRAKWIKTGPMFEKVPLTSTEDVAKMAEFICETYRQNEKYL